MKKTLLTFLMLGAISGCATQIDPERLREANEPLICDNKDQCDLYWQRAQIFIANNSFWKIQIANDVVIQTYGPGDRKVESAYSLTKVPQGGGVYRIQMRIGCDNIFLCKPRPEEGAIALKRYIKDLE